MEYEEMWKYLKGYIKRKIDEPMLKSTTETSDIEYVTTKKDMLNILSIMEDMEEKATIKEEIKNKKDKFSL